VESSSPETLKNKFVLASQERGKLRILLVPGHDEASPGTVYKGLREVDMNLALSEELLPLFKNDSQFEVLSVRDRNGYKPFYLNYFFGQREAIRKFIEKNKEQMQSLLDSGSIELHQGVIHQDAILNIAETLYGINKYASENNFDLVIHIHFNDAGGRRYNQADKYSGFAIYVPEKQYSNSRASIAVATKIFNRLALFNPVSNLPKEDSGIVQEQNLIAIGAFNTLDPAGMLIEYGYIYEPEFQDPVIRQKKIKDLAFQTYLGIQDFFGTEKAKSFAYNSTLLPYLWQNDLEKGIDENLEVLYLQTALALDGHYPPSGKDNRECPIIGSFGPCTEKAVKAFQAAHDISPVSGYVGPQTRALLNKMFGKGVKL